MLESAGVRAKVYGVRVGRGKLRKAAATAQRAHDLQSFLAQTGEAWRRPDCLARGRRGSLAAWNPKLRDPRLRARVRACVPLHELDRDIPRRNRPRRLSAKGSATPPAPAGEGHQRRPDFRRRGRRHDRSLRHRLRGRRSRPCAVSAAVGDKPLLPRSIDRDGEDGARAPGNEGSSRRVFPSGSPAKRRCLTDCPGSTAVTLSRSVPFVSLLKSVDAVVCSGGTMLREAAYLGIPAYSILQSEIGAVDRWLERIGRAKLIARPQDDMWHRA